MKKQNPVLETLKKMNHTQEEEKEMTKDKLQNEILKEQLRQLKELKEDSNKPSLTVYLLLALFLGGIGAHHFYNGKTLRGLLYLVFVWTMIPSGLALIDMVIALINKNKFK